MTSEMRPAGSMPMTPALTPASMASVKRRRASIGFAGVDQIVALLLQLIGHQVEGLGQGLQIVRALDDRDLGVEIAARHAARGIEQAHDRGHQLVGEPQADPDRAQAGR